MNKTPKTLHFLATCVFFIIGLILSIAVFELITYKYTGAGCTTPFALIEPAYALFLYMLVFIIFPTINILINIFTHSRFPKNAFLIFFPTVLLFLIFTFEIYTDHEYQYYFYYHSTSNPFNELIDFSYLFIKYLGFTQIAFLFTSFYFSIKKYIQK